MADNKKNNRGLQELGGSDFEIADGQPNIKGWDVKDDSGKKIGKVKELLFDATSLKVRYIITDLKGNDYDLDAKKVLVPIGVARLHENDDDVILPAFSVSQLQSLPEYDEDSLTPDFEQNVRSVFAGAGGAGLAAAAMTTGSASNDDETFYDHDHFNEENLYSSRTGRSDNQEAIPVIKEELQVGKKEVVTGGVRLTSRIVERPVQEELRLREESVRVERTPVNRPANETDLREETVELTEKAEVPVVSKEAHVIEEISLSKETTERTETISDTVRSTEVDVEHTGTSGSTSTRTKEENL